MIGIVWGAALLFSYLYAFTELTGGLGGWGTLLLIILALWFIGATWPKIGVAMVCSAVMLWYAGILAIMGFGVWSTFAR